MSRIQSKPSQTAKVVCYMRSLAYLEEGPPIANDHLASLFLSPKTRKRIQSKEERKTIIEQEIQPANYSYLTARTLHLDRLFQEAIIHETKQVVLLGAGYDSRAYRFHNVPEGFRVFEVDIPTTQKAKQRYLKLAQIETPSHVHFVPIDFLHESLYDALCLAGYSTSQKTLFLWEGVTYYISAQAVIDTLRFVQQHSGAGSRIAFDSLYAHTIAGDYRDHGAKEAVSAVAHVGEPFIFGIPKGKIASFLEQQGCKLLQQYSASEFQKAYLTESFPPMYGFMVNAVALCSSTY